MTFPDGGWGNGGVCLHHGQFKFLIDECAFAGKPHWQPVDQLDRNVEHARNPLANGAQHGFQALRTDVLAGYDPQHDPSQDVLIILVLSEHIGVVVLIQADDRDGLAAAAEDEFL
jgi:hypothetical protein